eukprot:9283027-Pyramimonas_sp.AAC.1
MKYENHNLDKRAIEKLACLNRRWYHPTDTAERGAVPVKCVRALHGVLLCTLAPVDPKTSGKADQRNTQAPSHGTWRTPGGVAP